MEFQASVISEVKVQAQGVLLYFSEAAFIVQEGAEKGQRFMGKASIFIGKAKYKKLPPVGRLRDGELYGIPGKALNGRVPVELERDGYCELSLSYGEDDLTIEGKHLEIRADFSSMPTLLKH